MLVFKPAHLELGTPWKKGQVLSYLGELAGPEPGGAFGSVHRKCLDVCLPAQALAAFEGRTEVTPGDIYRVIPLCLRHRLRKDPLAEIDSGDKVSSRLVIYWGHMAT